jgi:hypothetical protein
MNRARLVRAAKKMFMTIDSIPDENAVIDGMELLFLQH